MNAPDAEVPNTALVELLDVLAEHPGFSASMLIWAAVSHERGQCVPLREALEEPLQIVIGNAQASIHTLECPGMRSKVALRWDEIISSPTSPGVTHPFHSCVHPELVELAACVSSRREKLSSRTHLLGEVAGLVGQRQEVEAWGPTEGELDELRRSYRHLFAACALSLPDAGVQAALRWVGGYLEASPPPLCPPPPCEVESPTWSWLLHDIDHSGFVPASQAARLLRDEVASGASQVVWVGRRLSLVRVPRSSEIAGSVRSFPALQADELAVAAALLDELDVEGEQEDLNALIQSAVAAAVNSVAAVS